MDMRRERNDRMSTVRGTGEPKDAALVLRRQSFLGVGERMPSAELFPSGRVAPIMAMPPREPAPAE